MVKGNARRKYRRRASSSDDDETLNEVDRSALQETREAQKYRKRSHGVDSIGLGTIEIDREAEAAEAKKQESLADQSAAKVGLVIPKKYEAIFGEQLQDSARPTVQKHLNEYIDKEIARMQGKGEAREEEGDDEDEYFKSDEFQQIRKEKAREEAKSIMLSGIPEVDLGVESKMRNIEETEKMKQEHQAKMTKHRGRGYDGQQENYRFSRGRPVLSDQNQRQNGRGGRGGSNPSTSQDDRSESNRKHPGGSSKGMASDDHVMALFRKRQRRY
eukprot:CFRG3567T1